MTANKITSINKAKRDQTLSTKPYVIVLGNEKGGTGKSTLSMHIMTQLLRLGNSVASIDVDARQGTLSRYLENRKAYALKENLSLPMPTHKAIFRSQSALVEDAQKEEAKRMQDSLECHKDHDFIIIDTPGSDSYLSRLAHSYADTLITPLNDSFIDLDMLVRVQMGDKESMRPSTYSEMVWEQKKTRLLRDKQHVDWIVVRNRLSHIVAKNKLEMGRILEILQNRLGFRTASGLSERVIFRELFLSGLTLLDMSDVNHTMTLSHVSARQELRQLMEMINLPQLGEQLKLAS